MYYPSPSLHAEVVDLTHSQKRRNYHEWRTYWLTDLVNEIFLMLFKLCPFWAALCPDGQGEDGQVEKVPFSSTLRRTSQLERMRRSLINTRTKGGRRNAGGVTILAVFLTINDKEVHNVLSVSEDMILTTCFSSAFQPSRDQVTA